MKQGWETWLGGVDLLETHSCTFCCDDNPSWNVVDTDLLRCDKCQAVLAITYLPGLSTFATDKVTCSYERQLGSAHKEVCRFRAEAIHYFDQNERSGKTSTVPTEWMSYFSSDLMELAESSKPMLVLGQQVKERLIQGNVAWETIQMELHPSLKQYKGSVLNDMGTLEERLAKSLSVADFKFEDVSVDRVKAAILMVLLGWKPNTTGLASKECVSLHCDLCRKISEAPLFLDEQNSDEAERQAKRLRTSAWDPLFSHRYYCPYVCGFPRHGASRGTPLWKALADRLVENALPAIAEEETNKLGITGKSEWVQANALLNAGISRKGKVLALE
eukprot:scaffold34597_cov177-Amphora_coffeaeformis.AAC.30